MLPIPRWTKARLGSWIRNGWVLYASGCVKLYVACAVCSVRRVHGAGYGRAEHMCSRGEPLGLRGLLLMCRVTSWLHVWFGIRQEGLNPCRMVPSMKGRGTRQLHDVTGKVQRAWLRIAAQKCESRVAALVLREI